MNAPARSRGADPTAPGLPRPTEDAAQALADLALHGLCLVPAVLDRRQLRRVRDALEQAQAEDRRLARATTGFVLDRDARNCRIWNLLNRNEIFSELAEHPLALHLVRAALGWPALLSNISAAIVAPGACAGLLHADQVFVPEPWPAQPQGLNIAWCIDTFTDGSGATEVVPGSHRLNRNPRADEHTRLLPLEAPPGSLLAVDSRIWHRSGAHNTSDAARAGIFAFYTRPSYRTQENWFLALDREVVDRASDTLLTLLAYRTELFGLVYGRSPR